MDLVRGSRITLSPNSSLLLKSYVRLRLTSAGCDRPRATVGEHNGGLLKEMGPASGVEHRLAAV
jgi:hypothetical protein